MGSPDDIIMRMMIKMVSILSWEPENYVESFRVMLFQTGIAASLTVCFLSISRARSISLQIC